MKKGSEIRSLEDVWKMIMLGLMEQNREMGIGGVGAVKGGGGHVVVHEAIP